MSKRKTQRMMAWLLSAALIITQFSVPAYAQETITEGNLCEHHTEHIDCGYTEGAACTHAHDKTCGYVDATDKQPCTFVAESEASPADAVTPHEHDGTCGFAEAVVGVACTHQHTVADCGYVEGATCTFTQEQCELCTPKDSGNVALGVSSITVTAFDPLAKDISQRVVKVGTTFEQLNLPTALAASGYTVTTDTEVIDSGISSNVTAPATTPAAISIEGVTWELVPEKKVNKEYNPLLGTYCFTPALPEGYTLAEGVPLPEISVRVGDKARASDEGEFVFDISEGGITIGAGTNASTLKISYGENQTLDNVGIDQSITITGTATTSQMEVNTGTKEQPVKLIFDNLKIDRAASWSDSFLVRGAADVTLKAETFNSLSSKDVPGINLADNASITIGGDGSLKLNGGTEGIGGATSASVNITGGTITSGKISNVNLDVSGGTVETTNLSSATISGDCTITAATITGTVAISSNKIATFKGAVENKGVINVFGTLDATGASWTNGDKGNIYKVSGGEITGLSTEQYTTVSEDYVPCGDLWVKGGTVGTDYDYDSTAHTLTIKSDTAITILGTTITDKIVVETGVTANITLNDINIDVSSASSACAFELQGSAAVNLTLAEGSTNTLKSGQHRAGLQVQTKDGKTATIVIDGAGSLNAAGGMWGAGIGGGSDNRCGTVTINGGTITAIGGQGGAGIGKGDGGGIGGKITINGGTVNASSISKDPVNAANASVFLGKLTEQSGVTDVSVDNTPYYISENHANDTTLYLYMTGKNHTVQVKKSDGKVYQYNATYSSSEVNGGGYFNFVADDGGSAEAPSNESSLKFNSDKYTVPYSTATQAVTVTVTVKAVTNKNVRSAAMNSVFLALTKKDDRKILWSDSQKVSINTSQFKVDTSKLTLGDYTLTAVYGGSAADKGSEETATLTVNRATQAAPTVSFSFDGDNPNKLMGAKTTMEYILDGGTKWTACTADDMELTSGITAENDIKIRMKETDTHFAGAAKTIDITQGEAVSGVTATNCTTASNNDGKLTGVTSAMEYKLSADSDWTSITGNAITALKSGSYSVRTKATGTALSGNPSSYTIAPYSVTPTYGVSLTQAGTYTFAGAIVGYAEQAPLTVTVNNTGNQATGNIAVALSGTNSGGFTLSKKEIDSISQNGSDTFTIVPKTALAVGIYTAIVTVSGSNSISANFTVSFTVSSPAVTTHTITSGAGTGGTISPSGSVSVTNGENKTFTISANTNYSISSVTVDGVNKGAISTYTFENVTSNHSIVATFSDNGGGSGGGGSTGGGSGGGGGSTGGGTITPPVTPDNPPPPTTVESDVSGKTDKNGNATANVPNKDITKAIEKAQQEAKKNGAEASGIAITLNVKIDKNATSLTATLSAASIDALIKAGASQFTIKNSLTTVTLDLATLKALAGGEVKLSISKEDVKKLSKEAQTAIGNRPVFQFGLTSGGTIVSDFKGGRVDLLMPYTLTGNEQSGKLCGTYVDSKGNVTWLENSSYDANTGTLLMSITHFSVFGVGYKETATKFTDTANHWAKNDIDFVVARGLLSGTSSTTFAPDTSMTRGMFVTALGRLAGVDTKKFENTKFTDVKADTYYAPYVAWANVNGIVNGTTDTTFAPDQAITRQEMAVILVNYSKTIGYKLPSVHTAVIFVDASNIASGAKDAVKQMQMAGILMGKNGNRFDPTATATRAEVSAMLRRYVELVASTETAEGWAMNESGQWMYIQDGKRVTGKKTVDGKSYTFDQYGVTET